MWGLKSGRTYFPTLVFFLFFAVCCISSSSREIVARFFPSRVAISVWLRSISSHDGSLHYCSPAGRQVAKVCGPSLGELLPKVEGLAMIRPDKALFSILPLLQLKLEICVF